MGSAVSPVLGGLFGSSQRQDATTTPDATAQALNRMRLQQLGGLFGAGDLSSFVGPGAQQAAYTPTAMTQDLTGRVYSAFTGLPSGPTLSPWDYANTISNNDIFNQGLVASEANLGRGISNIGQNYAGALGANQAALNAALAANQGAYGSGLDVTRGNFNQALGLGMNSLNNYIAQVAAPQIRQNMALQGLEGGGAVNTALAKATAEAGLPLMQTLLPTFMGEQAQLAGQYGGNVAALEQAGLGNVAGLGQQNLAQQAQMLQGFNQGQLGYFGGYAPAQKQALSTIPGAFSTLGMLPFQQAASQAQTAGALFPMTDYSRALRESNVGRQQNLMTAGLTGIPFTPGQEQRGSTKSPGGFNLLGFGNMLG